ncbi:hypothetical protein HAX54_029879 [Datura stramonium]|uniref:Pentatricopeptide repeat-containing protein n=1 Tax=Datura stramonium TaxID=4076 RepID=A0ABS8V6Q0_DATST|nr:hypothetical protein [Datura stramonium]
MCPTWNSLIAGYAKNGNVEEAFKLFSVMPSRNVISWTAMISGCSQNGKYADALAVYKEMEKDGGVKPNEVTIASVLPACANLGALEVGGKIEAYARANGYFKNMRRNLCSWNTMIMGLAVHGKGDEALDFSTQMLGEGNAPDDVTFVGYSGMHSWRHGRAGKLQEAYDLIQSMPMRPDSVMWNSAWSLQFPWQC